MIFFASASANQTDLVEKEALKAGASDIHLSSGGVEFSANLETAYRFAMWTRSSTRLLVLIHRYDNIKSTDELFEHSQILPWENWINPEKTFAITETVSDCRWIQNSHFAALRLKDAIVERIREKCDGVRPSVNREDPDIVFHLHVNRDLVSWYVDFGGRSLSHRGYRTEQTEAVMSEFMAASLLYRSDWYRKLQMSFEDSSLEAIPLLDPFCGSGTICIEAALMATNTAPGLLKTEGFAFSKLPIHNEDLWDTIVNEAEEAQLDEPKCKIYGWDIDKKAIRISMANAREAGVLPLIEFTQKDFLKTTEEDIVAITPKSSGAIVTDPPYGVRLDTGSTAIARLYSGIGDIMMSSLPGWYITILCGNSELLSYVEMKPNRTNTLINGGIVCQVAHYYIFSKAERQEMIDKARAKREERLNTPLSSGAQMAANRLKKNMSSIGKAMAKENVTCYRLYDADMPEYSAAIDVYEGKWISLQEYAAPASIDPEDAKRRLDELILATERVTGIDLENIYVRRREIQKGASQYMKKGPGNSTSFIINENGHKFLVNFNDYLDTGIFLDHRPVRKLIENMSENKRFLNLFCYTATATVHAAAGGALSSVSVDASSTYLDWAVRNMQINGFNTMNHFFYKDDCMSFLKENRDVFDLIFCDPPTFSNSKGRGTFDVQRDHGYLIRSCMKHLASGGTLIFSTNFTRFKLFGELYEEFIIEDITDSTIGEDFSRNSKIHKCYLIRHRTEMARRIEPQVTTKVVKRIVKK
ncbi:MAG: bifunctional 23S rRNA (guanine(2069)-N(7))-methyltransferase RlmK/23S rRNA (guanine(2445)-N(2))-methyltransferase RlmL [Sphaerochaetaceae bacterium]|nr:bifunctional 23S rRNA (guanine(2069)-N(7))-methyltransferase RlmK/23S rRNA (guanine(2445)-N(2))-methyltransferase RlmL [Sphaerochaetaceae bacterium]